MSLRWHIAVIHLSSFPWQQRCPLGLDPKSSQPVVITRQQGQRQIPSQQECLVLYSSFYLRLRLWGKEGHYCSLLLANAVICLGARLIPVGWGNVRLSCAQITFLPVQEVQTMPERKPGSVLLKFHWIADWILFCSWGELTQQGILECVASSDGAAPGRYPRLGCGAGNTKVVDPTPAWAVVPKVIIVGLFHLSALWIPEEAGGAHVLGHRGVYGESWLSYVETHFTLRNSFTTVFVHFRKVPTSLPHPQWIAHVSKGWGWQHTGLC